MIAALKQEQVWPTSTTQHCMQSWKASFWHPFRMHPSEQRHAQCLQQSLGLASQNTKAAASTLGLLCVCCNVRIRRRGNHVVINTAF